MSRTLYVNFGQNTVVTVRPGAPFARVGEHINVSAASIMRLHRLLWCTAGHWQIIQRNDATLQFSFAERRAVKS